MKGQCAFSLLFLLMMPVLPLTNIVADGAEPVSPHMEWFRVEQQKGSSHIDIKDIDVDGLEELIINEGKSLEIIDPPSYQTVVSLNNTSYPYYFQVENTGPSKMLMPFSNGSSSYFSVYSTDNVTEEWRSPEIPGGSSFHKIEDIDADGQKEIYWRVVNENLTTIYIFGSGNGQLEWTSGPIFNISHSSMINAFNNCDSDPALEIFVAQNINTEWNQFNVLTVFDGRTHAVEWSLKAIGTDTFEFPLRDIIDVDNDSGLELVVLNTHNGNASGPAFSIGIYSAGNGTLEWQTAPETGLEEFNVGEPYSLGGRPGTQMLVTRRWPTVEKAANYTHEIFDLYSRSTLWKFGPVTQNQTFGYWLYLDDIDEKGGPEIILDTINYSSNETPPDITHTILDGRDFHIRWTSPVYRDFYWTVNTYKPDVNSSPRLLLICWTEENHTYLNGTVRVYSTDDFRELWHSAVYPGRVSFSFQDVLGDSGQELMITTQRMSMNDSGTSLEIFDGRNFNRLWSSRDVRLHCNDVDFGSADFDGNGARELLFVNRSWDGKYTGNSYSSWCYSTLLLYNDDLSQLIWSSGRIEGDYTILDVRDMDNDTKIEVYFRIYQDWSPGDTYFILEFPRDAVMQPGIHYFPPSVEFCNPLNGDKVSENRTINGLAWDDSRLAFVELRIDDGPWTNTTFELFDENHTCNWSWFWDLSSVQNGTFNLSARAYDGCYYSPEARITVQIAKKAPPPPPPPPPPKPERVTSADPTCSILIVLSLLAAVSYYILRMRK
jgi:hypothetical protein